MFFDDPAKVPELAAKSGFSIFIMPKNTAENIKFPPKNSIDIKPDEKTGKITVEKGNDGNLGLEIDINIINRKD